MGPRASANRTADYHSEWYRCATLPPHEVTRRQILAVEGGYTLSAVELLGAGPVSLRDYQGGWQFPAKVYPSLAPVEAHLRDNGWTLEVPTPGLPPELRKRSGVGGKSTVPQRAVRMRDELWARLGEEAAARGSDRNKLINEIVEDYLEKDAAHGK